MIFLFGGSPRCGKTILAKKLSRKTGASFISTDAIYRMMIKTVSRADVKKKFPQEVMRTPKGKFRLDVYSARTMLQAQVVEAKTMWPSIKALIVFMIDSNQDYIVEGIHLFPHLVSELKQQKYKDYWKEIKVAYLIKTNAEKIKAGFSKNKSAFDWMYPAIKKDPLRIDKAADMVKVKSEYIEAQAKKQGFTVFNTESDFEKMISKAQRYFLN